MKPIIIVQTPNFRVVRVEPKKVITERFGGYDALGNHRWLSDQRDDLEEAQARKCVSLRLELIQHIEKLNNSIAKASEPKSESGDGESL
jgi:hypothetical protein